MTQPKLTNKEEPKTDEQILAIIAAAIRDFYALSTFQRQCARRCASEWLAAKPEGKDYYVEIACDNLDFQGG
jgi:hypothetical protein